MKHLLAIPYMAGNPASSTCISSTPRLEIVPHFLTALAGGGAAWEPFEKVKDAKDRPSKNKAL